MTGALTGLLPSRRLPLLALLALTAALLWLPSADFAQAQSPAAQTVPSDWEHVPDGIEPGDSFRLLFVTSATRDASSSDIADYNAFVQSAANGNSGLKPYKDAFTALISTASVDARDNTATTGAGVSVHWLGGEKVADDYADLYDKSWDSVSGKTEGGSSYTGLVWTGGNKAGGKSGQKYAGAAEVRLGDLSDATLPLSSPNAGASSDAYPLYALSPVFTVAEPAPEPTPTPAPTPTPQPEPEQPSSDEPAVTSGPVVTSSPQGRGSYGRGEAIRVSVTFSEAVTVTGGPRLRIAVGKRNRWAWYSGGSDSATLTFAYTVRRADADADGVSIGADQLGLNRGSIADADGNAADLSHPALADQSGHKVDGSRKPAPNSPPAFAANHITLSVAEDAAIGANVGGPVAATDPDGDPVTYTFTGSDAFAIDRNTGQITVQTGLDYETSRGYLGNVSAGDGVNDAVSTSITIQVINVDEPGTASLIAEGGPPRVGSPVTASVSDPDGVTGDAAWTWHRSSDGETWEAISGATGASYTPTQDDEGRYLRATAAYADGHGSGKTASAATQTPVAAAQREGQPQSLSLTGTIVSGTAKTNVADLSASTFTAVARFTACVGDTDCTLTASGGVAAGTKITSVGITVAANGQIDYDGTPLNKPVLKVGAWGTGVSVIRFATITVSQPATTTTTIWSATLTVDHAANFYGCDNSDAAQGNCSSSSVLTDDDFTYGGTTYTVTDLFWHSVSNAVRLSFGTAGSTVKSALGSLTLNLDSSAFAINAASIPATNFLGWDSNLGWTDGQTVSVSLTAPASLNVAATVDSSSQVTLSWSNVTGCTGNPCGYRYRYRQSGGTWSSFAFTSSLTSQAVTGLTAGTTYEFNVQRRRSAVTEAQGTVTATTSPATTTTAIWSATLTVDKSGTYFGCDNSDANMDNCSSSSVLTDDDFVYGGTTYTVTDLFWDSGNNEINLSFGIVADVAQSALSALTLNLGSTALAIADSSRASSDTISWPSNLGWTDNQAVSVSLTAAPTTTTPDASGGVTVPHDWQYIPSGVSGGQSFRLLFVASTARRARSTDIADYNTHVQTAANANAALKPYKDRFRALISTSAVDARDNTATTGTGVPIYWLGGAKAADDYADFYDGSWDSRAGKTETGGDIQSTYWAGSQTDGTKHASNYAGASSIMSWTLNNQNEILARAVASTSILGVIALSPVFTVEEDPVTVPAGWQYIPSGVSGGQSFRLLFVTSAKRNAQSTDIADYNTHVQNAANANAALKPFKDRFRALISTSAVDARDNTATTGTGVPIYWLGGAKAADNYADFYDGSWDSRAGKTEAGASYTSWVWTGSTDSGTKGNVYVGKTSGISLILLSSTSDPPISGGGSTGNTFAASIYALSPLITVEEDPTLPPNFVATPGDRHVVLHFTQSRYYEDLARFQFRQKSGAGSYGDWKTIPGSVLDIWSHTVRGLTNGTAYTFQMRGVDKDGNQIEEPSDERTVTPRALTRATAHTVPKNWELIPEGLGPGDRFRLIFVTSVKVTGESTDIVDYNRHAQDYAIKIGETRSVLGQMVDVNSVAFATQFRALVSTATVDARVNTATTGTGVPIHWVNGPKVADNYADFYDGSWDSSYVYDQDGDKVWYGSMLTGSQGNGVKDSLYFAGSPIFVVAGHVPGSDSKINGGLSRPEESQYIYAVSPVLTVAR